MPIPNQTPNPSPNPNRDPSLRSLLRRPVIHYDKISHVYWTPERDGNYTSILEDAARDLLRQCGLNPKTENGEVISQLDREMNRIRMDCGVDFAGPISGYPKGLHQVSDRKCLVTRTFKLIKPGPGDWPTIDSIFEGLFGQTQSHYIFLWLKRGYEALAAGKRSPGQALVFAGPVDCGKSFVQGHIITPILGGRSCRCYRYLRGDTTFNGDMFEVEHLMVDDDVPSSRTDSRLSLAAHIKSIVASGVQSCHYKNRDAFPVTPFWRLTMSVNDSQEELTVLPIMTESIKDKISLFKASTFEMPMPTVTEEEREAFRARIEVELPAFIAYLLRLTIPEDMQSRRFGVTHYHDPDLVDALHEISPEARLLAIIDPVLFSFIAMDDRESEPNYDDWQGTASDLERQLMASDFKHEVGRILTWSNACGTYLGRLAALFPWRVEKHRMSNNRAWIIHPPRQEPPTPGSGNGH